MFERKYNIIILIGFLLLLLVSIFFAFRIKFDYNFEAFFPHDNQDLDFYNEFKQKFEPDDNYILIAIKNGNGSIFDQEFLKKVESFSSECDSLPFVIHASSLVNLKRPVFFAGSMINVHVIDTDKPEKYISDSTKIMNDPRLVGRFVAENGNSLAVILKTGHVLKLGESRKLGKALDDLLEKYNFSEYHIAGRAHYQALFVQQSKKEFFTFSAASALLIFLILIIIFRKVWGVLIALTSVLIAMIMFMGFLGAFQIPLDPMSTLFPILMLIVGVSDIIHIMSKYVDELNKGTGRKEAIRKTVREIGFATFLTSATTAIGFASLFTSNIPPIKHFGITAAIGVFIAYIAVLLFTTSVISLFGAHHIIRKKRHQSGWDIIMKKMFHLTYDHPKIIGASGLVVVIFCLIGISQISTNVHIENTFPTDHKALSDFQFFENEFGGVRTAEIGVIAKNGYKITDQEILQAIDSVEDHIVTYDVLKAPVSPATMYKSLNQAYHADNPDAYELPESETQFEKFTDIIDLAPETAVNFVTSEDKKFGRLSAKFVDQGSDSNKSIRNEITAWINENIDTSMVTFKHTGTSLLFDKNNEYLRGSLFSGLGLAFLLISILMALLFRNWKMVIISLIPNIIPLLVAGAIIGYLGIELDAATSIIFAIAFGVAVDDTIHFLSKFKLELSKGKEITEAIRSTFAESGKAICITSVILFFGFIILMISNYPPTFYIGFLVSLTLMSALIADLFLIPILIYWLLGKNGTVDIKQLEFGKRLKKRSTSVEAI